MGLEDCMVGGADMGGSWYCGTSSVMTIVCPHGPVPFSISCTAARGGTFAEMSTGETDSPRIESGESADEES